MSREAKEVVAVSGNNKKTSMIEVSAKQILLQRMKILLVL